MVGRIEKVLRKLSDPERKKLKMVLKLILAGNLAALDVQKLKGHEDIFRVRKGDLRIIFLKKDTGAITILALERRSESTYKDV